MEVVPGNLKEHIKKIKFPTGSAGANITANVPIINKESRIDEVIKLLFDKSDDFDTINYIYVVNSKNKLKGVFSIKEIFAQNGDAPAEMVMNKRFVKVHPEADQEKVVKIAIAKSIKAVPVVDKNGVFLGVVQNDKINSIFQSETREDILKLAGFVGAHAEKKHVYTVWESYKYRIPWILLGILGGVFTAGIISLFEGVLQKNLLLASFIPLVAYTANAVGNQTQTLFIRDLAIIKKLKFVKYFTIQLLSSFLIALTCMVFIYFLGGTLWGAFNIGAIVGISVFAAITIATVFALIIPFILTRLDLDPAMGSGPFTTIIQDFMSILTYFLIASLLI